MFKVGDCVTFKKLDWGTEEEITVSATVTEIIDSQTVKLDSPNVTMNVKDLTKTPERPTPFGSII